VNDRKIFNAIADFLELSDDIRKKLLPLLDEYLKLPKDKFEAQSAEILSEKKEEFFRLFAFKPTDKDFPNEAIEIAFASVHLVIESLQKNGINAIFDPYIIRGQDYYTGTVFEFKVPEKPELGSIA
jgi:histidyl-tRNA synthetase